VDLLSCRHNVLTRKFQWESVLVIRVMGIAIIRMDTIMAIIHTDTTGLIDTTAITMAAIIIVATATTGTIGIITTLANS
jgi:hypothetical protein